MFFFKGKHFQYLILLTIYILLSNCQINKKTTTHGINFLENRSKLLIVSKSNKNDIIDILGQPLNKSFNNDSKWFYFETKKQKDKLYKLGKEKVTKNNVLILSFDKYGVLIEKKLVQKDNMNKIKFSNKETVNNVKGKSFVGSFLSSIRQKMYSNRDK